MKKILLFISLLIIAFGLKAQTIVSGNITGVWEAGGNPYIVVGDINIVNMLIIEPGVLIQFQAGGWMIEAGEGDLFVARGTNENPIIFEPYQGNEPGLWDKIYFNNSNDNDTLKYCMICGATIGVNIHTSRTVVIGSQFYNNETGIYVTNYGMNSYALAEVINCSFINNEDGLHVAGYYGPLSAVTNSVFAYNNLHGIRNSSVGPFGAQDIIYSCFYGNIDNYGGISYPTGFGLNGDYLNFNEDSCDVNYNIYYDPCFVDTSNSNFNLQPISKCIDAGTNLILGQFTSDPDCTMPDMGANYYDQTGVGLNEIVVHYMNIFPNPFSLKTSITFPNLIQSNYAMSIFNISGNKVFEKENINSDKIEFEKGNLPAGIYLVELKGEKVYWGKMVVK